MDKFCPQGQIYAGRKLVPITLGRVAIIPNAGRSLMSVRRAVSAWEGEIIMDNNGATLGTGDKTIRFHPSESSGLWVVDAMRSDEAEVEQEPYEALHDDTDRQRTRAEGTTAKEEEKADSLPPDPVIIGKGWMWGPSTRARRALFLRWEGRLCR